MKQSLIYPIAVVLLALTLLMSWRVNPFGMTVANTASADDTPASAAEADPLKVVLIAGPKSHGPVGNGIHDYPWSVRLIKVLLDNSNVADQLAVEYHLDGWPADASTLDDADTILVISDGRDGDLYAEAPHLESPEHIAAIQRQIDRGCGFMTFHFSTFAPDAYAEQILDWTGGYFDWETDGERAWYSAITTVEADVSPATPDHPVLSGIAPFRMNEEFYYNIRFADTGVSPLLNVAALDGREPDGRTVAWARERDDGGRGFGTTCGHFYDNWQVAEFRRLILNAIVWTAGGEVPSEGVESRFYAHAEIMAALDGVEGTAPAKLDDEPISALIITGAQHPAHVWQDTTPALQEALEQDPRFAVTVSEDIECLKEDLSKYDLLLLNYCNWERPPLSEESKQGLLDYLAAGGGLVLVHFSNGAFHFSLPGSEDSDWPEYRNICRRVWDHTPGLSGHDAYGQFDVEVIDQEHDITRGLETFRTTDELYFRQQGDQPIHVLAEARSQVTGECEPMAFVYDYGEARVFQTVLGHAAESIRNEGASELISRAAAWVARREQLEPARRRRSTATTSAVPPLMEGRFGTALNTAAGGAYIALDEVFRHPPLTVECWARLNSFDGFNILVAHENKDSATHWELFTQAGDGHLAAYLPGMSPDHARSTVNVCDGQWHYVAMTYEADRVRLFVDGTQVADQPMQRASDATVPAALAIGRLVDGGIGCDGLIDEVRISSGVRDVSAVPEEPLAVDDSTIALWRFDAVTPRDAAGNGTLFTDETNTHPAILGQNAAVLGDGEAVSDNDADDATDPDHWGREVVGFDWTEDDSRDSRWQEMEIGPSLASIVELPGGAVAKGLTVRLQDGDQTASVCYDTATMQMRAAWTGGFLQFDAARYGIIVSPRPQGEPILVRNRAQSGGSTKSSTEVTTVTASRSFSPTRLMASKCWNRRSYSPRRKMMAHLRSVARLRWLHILNG